MGELTAIDGFVLAIAIVATWCGLKLTALLQKTRMWAFLQRCDDELLRRVGWVFLLGAALCFGLCAASASGCERQPPDLKDCASAPRAACLLGVIHDG